MNVYEYMENINYISFSLIKYIEFYENFPLYYKEKFFHDFKDTVINNEIYMSECFDFVKLLLDSQNYYDFISKYNLFLVNYDYVIDSINNPYKITIVIPIYNIENSLYDVVESIKRQNFPFEELEVILVDDCSNDETKHIIDEFSNKYSNIKAIHLKENTGSPGTPRNIGIKEAKSDYIIFLDHDDCFADNALNILYHEIINNNLDVVFGYYASVDYGKVNKITFYNEKNGYFEDLWDNERLVAFPPPSIWTKLFRKEFLIKNNILFPPYFGEDAIFFNKVLLKCNGIKYLNDSLIYYHNLNENSATNNVSIDYLIQCLMSEKYLFNLYESIEKEYLFKYRCESTLNFYLNQFFKCNFNKMDLFDVLPLFNWYVEKADFYNIKPNEKNIKLFEFILQNDLTNVFNLINGQRIYDEKIVNDLVLICEDYKNLIKDSCNNMNEKDLFIEELKNQIHDLNIKNENLNNKILELKSNTKWFSKFKK